MEWVVKFYRLPNGRAPVEEFLRELPAKPREKVVKWIEFLEEFGPEWGKPHIEQLAPKIRQLRVKHGSNIYRIPFFTASGQVLVLTHGFVKKDNKTPQREIERAKRYREDYFNRYEEK